METTKKPVSMVCGVDYNHPLHRRYEYVLFAADETVVARKSGFSSKKQAHRAGELKAAAILGVPARPM